MYILNAVSYIKTNGSSAKFGYLKYDNNALEFWKYKGFPGKYDMISYLVIKLITLFMKDKLRFSIKKDDIQSMKIEEGLTMGGLTGRMMSLGGSNKLPDQFVVTTKDGTEYRFAISYDQRKDDDNASFEDLVVNMGMFMS